MAMIALKCPHIKVTVVDISQPRIGLEQRRAPIYEPGLDEVVKACRGKNLFFSTDVAGAIRESQMIFVSVNTPTKKTGLGSGKAADLTYQESARENLAAESKDNKIIVEKSTVPVRTARPSRRCSANCSDSTVSSTFCQTPSSSRRAPP